MKKRFGFVTNSSSSSFIIAMKNNCTEEDIKDILYENTKSILNFIEDDIEYSECAEEIKNIKDSDKQVQRVIEILASKLFEECNNNGIMTIEDWNINSVYGNNEDDEILGMYLYTACPDINNNKIKIGSDY